MPIDYSALKDAPRLLIEATLRPLQGDRFQSTGFADLGPARYTVPNSDGTLTEKLLVESAQSVANHLEMACWDDAENDWIKELRGIPFVRIDCGSLGKTSTVQEFHRLNSPYIWKGEEMAQTTEFRKAFLSDLGITAVKTKKSKDEEDSNDSIPGVIDRKRFHHTVFKWDPNSLMHGLFLEKIDGRLRITRALSGFIEATGVRVAESGGTKVDNVLPSPKRAGVDAKGGFGNVPYHRTEFTAEKIVAFFNLDLALIRGYALGEAATHFMIAFALLKITRFLASGLRLRAACDLEEIKLSVTRPVSFSLPSEDELLKDCAMLIEKCKAAGLFVAEQNIVVFKLKLPAVKVDLPLNTPVPVIPAELKSLIVYKKPTAKKGGTITVKPEIEKSPEEIAELLFPTDESARLAIIEAYDVDGEAGPDTEPNNEV
ncbi:MAG: type I-U CRISPR-associated RAMP protein Csb1/Cas7u [Verrucomicrobiota bacterium]